MVPNILKKKLQHSTFFIYIFISNNNIRNEKYNAYNTRTEEEYLKQRQYKFKPTIHELPKDLYSGSKLKKNKDE